MRVSGFTIARDVEKYNYPFLESIKAVLPICDEFVVNVGKSQDNTLELVKSLRDPKIKIIETIWNREEQKDMLSHATNVALKACTGDWALYVQADELIHEADLPRLQHLMKKYLHDQSVDALRFEWLHFYGTYHRYRIDRGWFQKQQRIVRNNGEIESCTDAWTFRRKDGQPVRIKRANCLLYHYGWVQPGEVMTQRRVMAEAIYAPPTMTEQEKKIAYDYGDLNRFPIYFGTHPAVMQERIAAHESSRQDWQEISRKYWWHPLYLGKFRWKTSRRVREALGNENH